MVLRLILRLSAALLGLAAPLSVAQAAPPLSAYGELPGLERAAISPNGTRVAIVATVNEVRSLLLVENGAVFRKISLGDIKLRDIEWANNEVVLVDFSQTERLIGFTADKAEFFRTYVIPMSAEKPSILFSKQKEIADATFGWHGIRDVGGKTYGFFGGVPLERVGVGSNIPEYSFNGGSPGLYRVDMTTMAASPVSSRPSDGEWRDYLIDEKGELAVKLFAARQSGQWKIRNANGEELAAGVNKQGGISLTAFGNNGKSLIFRREDEISKDWNYFEVSIIGGEAPRQILADVEIERLFIHRRTNILMGYLQGGAASTTRFFDPVLDKKIGKIAKAFPKLKRQLIDWTPDLSKVLVTTHGNGDSGTWWQIDLNASAASHVGAERVAIPPAEVGSISTVSYTAADGMQMDGILTLPVGKAPKNLPLIMLPHGGPTAHDSETFDWWAQGLASRGYAVFQPNFRGSTNRDAAFVKAGHGEWGRKMQTDISDGLAHLAARGIVDPKRACIVGASYGGYAALAGVTLQKGIYRCAVSVAGVSDLSLMISTDMRESGNNPMLKRYLEAEIGKGRELKDVSPRRFAAQADAPILLVHGKDDVVVPYNQSTVMADALKDAKKPYELVTLAGEDHWLSRNDTRKKMLDAVVAFVEKHNPAK
jgi:dipeptidyl aminopeptidase/acylaminoacyl peptidase